MLRPATLRQREYLAALIVEGTTVDEVQRLIRELRRERARTKDLLAAILEAKRAADRMQLGQLLLDLKGRTKHGEWIKVLELVGISPRRAQRAMRDAKRNGGG